MALWHVEPITKCCFKLRKARRLGLSGCGVSGVEASETTEREIDVAVRDIITKAFECA
jgi:hypothetical protein